MTVAICPSCGEDIKIQDNPKLGQRLLCQHCDAELEVIELDPVELDWADYGDYDDYEEEDW